jgi:hypothetical protein
MAEASTRGAAEASVRESYPLHSVAGVRAKGSKSMRPQACLFPYLLGNLPQYQSLFQIVIRLTALRSIGIDQNKPRGSFRRSLRNSKSGLRRNRTKSQ